MSLNGTSSMRMLNFYTAAKGFQTAPFEDEDVSLHKLEMYSFRCASFDFILTMSVRSDAYYSITDGQDLLNDFHLRFYTAGHHNAKRKEKKQHSVNCFIDMHMLTEELAFEMELCKSRRTKRRPLAI